MCTNKMHLLMQIKNGYKSMQRRRSGVIKLHSEKKKQIETFSRGK